MKLINDRILIIDGLNSYLRIFSSVPNISEHGEFVGGIVGMLRSIAKDIREFNPTKCILVFDGKGGSVRRKKIYPEYKGNRSGSHGMRMDLFQSVEEERESMKKQLIRLFQYFENLPIQTFMVENVEADDVIAYLVQEYFKPTGSTVRIISTDRDFLQLIDARAEVYSPVKKKLYDSKRLYDELKLSPQEYLTYRVVTGDSSDNIDGVKGVGIKTLLKHFPNPTSISDLIHESKLIVAQEKKPKQIFKSLIECESLLYRNYDLMQLQYTDISAQTKLNILERLNNPKLNKYNSFKIRKMMIEDGIINSFKNLDEWLLLSFSGLNVWV